LIYYFSIPDIRHIYVILYVLSTYLDITSKKEV